VDALSVNAMLLVLTFGIRSGSILFFEAALIIAPLGFAGTLARAKFLMRGEVIEWTCGSITLPPIRTVSRPTWFLSPAGPFAWARRGITPRERPPALPVFPIGLALTLIHLVSIPVTSTSVNPARSTGPGLFAGGEYIVRLWLIGASIAGLLTRWM
jgi:glycerol uptake facilitator-like aquaporin